MSVPLWARLRFSGIGINAVGKSFALEGNVIHLMDPRDQG